MHNPIVIALGRDYKPVRIPMYLSEVVGMAYGVREDIQNGKIGLIGNQCTTSTNVYFWDVVEDVFIDPNEVERLVIATT